MGNRRGHIGKDDLPLVTIICFCRNEANSIGRCIDSILSQDYPNIQVVVQDGNSTDGTLEILESYGNRIELVSEPDNGAGDAMFRALARVKGEYFNSCLADEQLLPHAVTWAVKNLVRRPAVAAIYGDHYLCDANGVITGLVRPGPWNFAKFLRSEFMPPFCASFFRTDCFRKTGLCHYTDCGEFELWLRIGARFAIEYVPGIVARYGVRNDALSFQVNSLAGVARGRRRAIERICQDPATPEYYRGMKQEAQAGTHTWLVNCYCTCQAWDMALKAFYRALDVDRDYGRLQRAAARLVMHGIECAKQGKVRQAERFLKLPRKFPHLFPGLHSPVKTECCSAKQAVG